MNEENSPNHPATVRLNRIRLDGSIKPFSIDEQWKQVADWHAFFVAGSAAEFPILDCLANIWESVEPIQSFHGKPCIERGADMERVAGSPLAALFYMIDMGFYPPPELLLALLDCWETYSASGGRIGLEEAFLGKPIQKAGNYAKQRSTKFLKFMRQMELHKLMREGKTPIEAAEAVSEMFGGRIEPESILREMRIKRPAKTTK